MLTLYNFATSTCSQKVRICLAEKGLDWTDRQVNLGTGENLTPDYLRLNPNGVVPTLVHNGAVIVDSSVIMEYLDEAFPEVSLTPSDIIERAHMRSWLRFIEEVPTVAIRYPSFQHVLGPIRRYRELNEAEFREEAEKRPLRKHFFLRMGRTGFDQQDMDAATDNLQKTVARMEAALAAHGGPWLLGECFTLADACVAPTFDRLEDLGHAAMWQQDHPQVSAWWAHLKERPSYRTAFYPGSRFSEAFPAAFATAG